MNKYMKPVIVGIWAACFLFFMYGGYWVAKNGSYWLFYEDMVQQTIAEEVKSECLINQ